MVLKVLDDLAAEELIALQCQLAVFDEQLAAIQQRALAVVRLERVLLKFIF